MDFKVDNVQILSGEVAVPVITINNINNGRFYIYTSSDSQYGGNDFNDLDVTVCLSSDDMVNWKYEGDVFRAKKDTTWASMAWAPAAIERDGEFYLYFANGGVSIGVEVSEVLQDHL